MLKVGFSSFLVCFTGQHTSSFASSLFYQLGALVSVPPPKKQTSEGGLYVGPPLVMFQLSVLARPIGKLRCLPDHTSSWMAC